MTKPDYGHLICLILIILIASLARVEYNTFDVFTYLLRAVLVAHVIFIVVVEIAFLIIRIKDDFDKMA